MQIRRFLPCWERKNLRGPSDRNSPRQANGLGRERPRVPLRCRVLALMAISFGLFLNLYYNIFAVFEDRLSPTAIPKEIDQVCRAAPRSKAERQGPVYTHHVLLAVRQKERSDSNPFHQLWLFSNLIRDALLSLDDDATNKVDFTVVLPQSFRWIEPMVRHFPNRKVKVEFADKCDDVTNCSASPRWVADWMRRRDGSECFIVEMRRRGGPKLLPSHTSWDKKTYTVDEQLRNWTRNVVARSVTKKQLKTDVCANQRPLVLFLERASEQSLRTLVDAKTGRKAVDVLAPQIEELGYDIERAGSRIDLPTPVEQVQILSRANVVVSPHGGQLSNLIYLNPDCATVIEVTPRLGWCNAPHSYNVTYTKDVLLDIWRSCEDKFFHKADYFALANTMGIRYIEVVNEGLGRHDQHSGNPIANDVFLVDTSLILGILRRMRSGDFKPIDFNGREGIEPYSKP